VAQTNFTLTRINDIQGIDSLNIPDELKKWLTATIDTLNNNMALLETTITALLNP
jgi:hypothetical protein